MKQIYLDYAAATPLDPEVLSTMQPYFSRQFYNPSATYLAARAVRQDIEAARHKIAMLVGARPAEIIFTAGATEANNLAIQGALKQFPESEVLISSIEHESVLQPAKQFITKQIPVDEKGLIILNKLSNLISDKTVLISVILVNNELGTIQPLHEISQIVAAVRKRRLKAKNKLPIYLHTDAAQAGNFLDIHVSRLGVDLMSLNGGKIYGSKQSGVLYVKAGTKIKSLIAGGGQEFGLRPGTENVPAVVGMAKALEIAQQKRADETKRILSLRKYFEDGLNKTLAGVIINGSAKHRAPHLISVTFLGLDNERLMMELDDKGIVCAVGSACSASTEQASHVLKAIGLSEEAARSTLRFSLGRFTTKADLEKTLRWLSKLTVSNR